MSAPFAPDLPGLDVAVADAPGMAQALAEILRPPERLSPSQWAARHRYLRPGTTEKPGRWDPTYFPHIAPIMDAFQEALEDDDCEGLVCMKAAQGAGSEGFVTTVGWARTYVDGPLLYLISKDDKAKEFREERFAYMAETAEPLKALHLSGRGSGENVHRVVFTNGKLDILGGKSVLNIESTPYPIVWVDEIDSLDDAIKGKGDLIKNIKARSKASRMRTLIVAFAHPTTTNRGAGKLYYHKSDQRRLFVDCPHGCGGEFWLCFDASTLEPHAREHAARVEVFPEGDETLEQAERNPDRYALVAPCCGATVSDSQRQRAIRTCRLRSTLPPEQAKRKRWIGVHFSELYYPHVRLRDMAADWIDGLGNEEVQRAVVNKSHGEVYEPKVQETSVDDWRALIWLPRHQGDPNAYVMGEVPPGVRFLTAGQDSRTVELHYSVWGWGLVRNTLGVGELVAWLIEADVVPRKHTPTIEAADLAIFDELLLRRSWPRTDGSGYLELERAYFDAGWCPLAVAEYVRSRDRAYACRGGNYTSTSTAPAHSWGAPMRYRDLDGEEVVDPQNKPAHLNTYKLRTRWYGLVGRRFEVPDAQDLHPRIVLPQDVPEAFLEQAASEFLTKDKQGRFLWEHKGPNHWADTGIYAYASALNLDPFQKGQTREEAIQEAKHQAERVRRRRAERGHRAGPRRTINRRY